MNETNNNSKLEIQPSNSAAVSVSSNTDQVENQEDTKRKKIKFIVAITMVALLIVGLLISIGFNIYFAVHYSGISVQKSVKSWFDGCESDQYLLNLANSNNQSQKIMIRPIPLCLEQNPNQLANATASLVNTKSSYEKVGSQASDNLSMMASSFQILGFILMFM